MLANETRSRYSNPGQERRERNRAAFKSVLNIYIRNKYELPLMRNGMAMIAADENPSARRGWTPDVSILIADCEKAMETALNDDTELLERLFEWFIAPQIIPGVEEPSRLTLEDSRRQSDIVQKVGREFIKRGIYPPMQYFTPWKRSSKRLATA